MPNRVDMMTNDRSFLHRYARAGFTTNNDRPGRAMCWHTARYLVSAGLSMPCHIWKLRAVLPRKLLKRILAYIYYGIRNLTRYLEKQLEAP
jgi:hypothetical protein